jgi:hypothetical protein
MNDEELAAAVKESVRGAHMTIPAEQIVHRSRAIRARRRTPALAGGLTVAAAASAVAALTLAGGLGAAPGRHAASGHTRTVVTAAWTVRQDADGTVTIYLRQYADPAGLQQTLRADGINAIVRPIPSVLQTLPHPPGQQPKPGQSIRWPACYYATTSNASPAIQRDVVTFGRQGDLPAAFVIHPAAMPQGSALFLTFLASMPASPKNGNTGVLALPPVVLDSDTVPACLPRTKALPSLMPKAVTPKPAAPDGT